MSASKNTHSLVFGFSYSIASHFINFLIFFPFFLFFFGIVVSRSDSVMLSFIKSAIRNRKNVVGNKRKSMTSCWWNWAQWNQELKLERSILWQSERAEAYHRNLIAVGIRPIFNSCRGNGSDSNFPDPFHELIYCIIISPSQKRGEDKTKIERKKSIRSGGCRFVGSAYV